MGIVLDDRVPRADDDVRVIGLPEPLGTFGRPDRWARTASAGARGSIRPSTAARGSSGPPIVRISQQRAWITTQLLDRHPEAEFACKVKVRLRGHLTGTSCPRVEKEDGRLHVFEIAPVALWHLRKLRFRPLATLVHPPPALEIASDRSTLPACARAACVGMCPGVPCAWMNSRSSRAICPSSSQYPVRLLCPRNEAETIGCGYHAAAVAGRSPRRDRHGQPPAATS